MALSSHILPPIKPVRQGDYLKCLIKQCYRNCGDDCQKQQEIVNKCEDESDICISWRQKIRMNKNLPDEFFYCKEHCQIKSNITTVYTQKFQCQINCAGGTFFGTEDDQIDQNDGEDLSPKDEDTEDEDIDDDIDDEKIDDNNKKIEDKDQQIENENTFDEDIMTDDDFLPLPSDPSDKNDEDIKNDEEINDDGENIDDGENNDSEDEIEDDQNKEKEEEIKNDDEDKEIDDEAHNDKNDWKEKKQKELEEQKRKEQIREEKQKQIELEKERKKKEEAEKLLPWYCKISDHIRWMC